MSLELAVNRALSGLTLVERALHDPSGWTMVWADQVVPAEVSTFDHTLSLKSSFADVCHLHEPVPAVSIEHRGLLLAVHPLPSHPGDGPVTLKVSFTVETEAPAEVQG